MKLSSYAAAGFIVVLSVALGLLIGCGDFNLYELAGTNPPGAAFLPSAGSVFFAVNGELWKAPIPDADPADLVVERVFSSPELMATNELHADRQSDAVYWSFGSGIYRYNGLGQELVVDAEPDTITTFTIDPNQKRLLIGLSDPAKNDIYESGLKPGSVLRPLNLDNGELYQPFDDLTFDPANDRQGTLFMAAHRDSSRLDHVISRLYCPGVQPTNFPFATSNQSFKYLACDRANEILYYVDGINLYGVNYADGSTAFAPQSPTDWLSVKDMAYDEVNRIFYLIDFEDAGVETWIIRHYDPATGTSTVVHSELRATTAIDVYRP